MVRGYCRFAAFSVVAAVGSSALAGLAFNFTYDGSIDANALAGFQQAGSWYSKLFSDDITVNIKIGFSNLGSGVLGQASSSSESFTYTQVRNAMNADKKSGDDFTAVANLQTGSSLNIVTNGWKNNPNGAGTLTFYNTALSMIDVNTANAKALGLKAGNDSAQDAQITFSSSFSWDFDPTNGIGSGQYDFVGVAAHEIGHALGFVSGVDMIDYFGSSYNDNDFAWITTLDLFRFAAGNTKPVLVAGTAAVPYFSLDQGLTGAANKFATGRNRGDGYQASHWKRGQNLGLMDPAIAAGTVSVLSPLDIQSWDVIGYDAVPEPATMVGLAVGALALLGRKRRSK